MSAFQVPEPLVLPSPLSLDPPHASLSPKRAVTPQRVPTALSTRRQRGAPLGLRLWFEASANILAEQTAIPAERKSNSEAALFKQSTRTCRGFYLLQEKLAEAAASSALPHPATRLPR